VRVARELRSPLGPALALTAAALFAGGGFGSSTLPWLGAAAALLSVAAVALGGVPGRLWTLAPLAALAAWSACSVAWSIEPDRSWDYADRAFVYLAFALVGTTLAGRTRALAAGLGALLGAVCAWALAGKVLPWLDEDYGRIARLPDRVRHHDERPAATVRLPREAHAHGQPSAVARDDPQLALGRRTIQRVDDDLLHARPVAGQDAGRQPAARGELVGAPPEEALHRSVHEAHAARSVDDECGLLVRNVRYDRFPVHRRSGVERACWRHTIQLNCATPGR